MRNGEHYQYSEAAFNYGPLPAACCAVRLFSWRTDGVGECGRCGAGIGSAFGAGLDEMASSALDSELECLPQSSFPAWQALPLDGDGFCEFDLRSAQSRRQSG